ncbi:MAG: molybdate ABC transporter substrate-binding protein [Gammaproteobacteria bacterium]|jgi:molybdate transport system substrate-binding protein
MRLPAARLLIGLALPGLGLAGIPARSCAESLTVAVAASATPVFRKIGSAFERQFGVGVTIVEGSSGSLYTQIVNGAPFDIFVAADTKYPGHLLAAGQVASGTNVVRYARGRLVAWVPGSRCRPGCLAALGKVRRPVAIANPALAPYGVAAVACLRFAGMAGQPRVMGGNVAQAYQFVASGNAGGGLVALSQVTSGRSKGRVNRDDYSVVSEQCHQPLIQALAILSGTHKRRLAEQFVSFLSTPQSRSLFHAYGFLTAVSDMRPTP